MAEPPRGGSGGLRMAIIAIVLVVLILIAIIGYAVAGYAAGESRVSAADKSLNAVVSDQNKLTKTFKEIDIKFSGLSAGTNFDAEQAKTLLGQFIADSQDATKTVVRDQASLTASSTKLDELQWLTTIDKGNINKAHARLDHAQKALASAKIVSDDYVQDGQFLQSFMDDCQTLTSDFGKLLDAAIAGDETGLTTYSDKLQTDVTKLGTYNFDQMGTDVTAFYKPYIDTFNSEMSAATA